MLNLSNLTLVGTPEHRSGDDWFESVKREALTHILSVPESQVQFSYRITAERERDIERQRQRKRQSEVIPRRIRAESICL